MFNVVAKVSFDKAKAIAMIESAGDEALTILGNQILKDTSQYVPKDQGTLENSGLINSDKGAHNGSFIIRWDTPYAQYLWHGEVMRGNPDNRSYGPEKLNFTSALAREEWAKYAQEVHGEEWQKVYEAALKRRLRK